MAWLEPFIAAFPQWVAAVKNTSIFSSFGNDENESNNPIDSFPNNSTRTGFPNTHLSNISNNINAITMYQRAITLQQTNSDNMNKKIFQSEPILSSATTSDFECDSDSDISSFSYSFINNNNAQAYNNNIHERERRDNNNNSNNSNDKNVLSEDEYIDLHSRLSFDDLSSELYESDEELPLWLSINELNNEFVVNNNNNKLNERDWRLLLKTIKDNKCENISLTLNNIVLDELAGHYIHKLSVHPKRNNNNISTKLTKLSIENAFFFTSDAVESKEEELYMFTQNEGILSDSDDVFCTKKERYFDFNIFCKSLLQNKELYEINIINSNLGNVLSNNILIKQQFMNVLSNHNNIKRINLSANNICDGTIFTDSLFLRKLPLHYLNVSYNPIPKNDIKSIKWIATKQYISPFEFDINYGNKLSVFKNKQQIKFQMEPIYNIQQDIDDMEEQQFITSLFPVNNQNINNKINFIDDSKENTNYHLNHIELGIQIKSSKNNLKNRKKKMCDEFIYIPPNIKSQPGSTYGLYNNNYDIDVSDDDEMTGQLMLRI